MELVHRHATASGALHGCSSSLDRPYGGCVVTPLPFPAASWRGPGATDAELARLLWRTWWSRERAAMPLVAMPLLRSAAAALLGILRRVYRPRARRVAEREREFRNLADNAPDVVIRFDRELRFRYVNPVVETYTGKSPAELVGRCLDEAGFPSENVRVWTDGVRRAFDAGELGVLEFTFDTPTGTRYFESRFVPELGADGVATTVLGITRDITEHRLAVEELRRSEASLAESQRMTHVGSWSYDVLTQAMWCSEELYRIHGLDAARPMTHMEAWFALVHPDDIERLRRNQAEHFEAGADFDVSYRIVRPDGEIRHLHAVTRLVRNPSAQLVRMVGTAMDVTERVQAEEALRTTQLQLAHVARVTQMGELTASIAHEVNQPLSAVIMGGAAGLRWLDRPIPDLDEVRTALRRIVEDANRAAQVLGRIRALAQQVTPQTSRILVEDVIRDVVEMLEYELTVQGVVLTTALRTHARPIVGDPIQLQQVMLNLIMNAAESLSGARAGERRIDVVAEFRDEEPHGVIVAVRDSGTEPPPENPELLFKPFYTTKASGMGLGLSICRSIVESHGGRLWATANDDRGMTFRFSLPVSDEHGGGHGGGHVVGPRIP